jgi:cytochrome c biogenesis protein
MRTALILLLMLAAASVVGSLVPQLPNSPTQVSGFLVAHVLWGKAFQAAGFFDVFGSWWFALVTALLFVSLVACLVPRSRAMIRAARQRPIQARELETFPSYTQVRVAPPPEDAARVAAGALRHKRYRVELDEKAHAVAADKGTLREIGSLVFHWAFLLLLIAVILGKGTGYVGHATIVEGTGWTDARLNYDGQLRTGRFFGGAFSGTQITLQDFQDAYRDTGQPMDYRSSLVLADENGGDVQTAEVRINHPVSYNGIRIFQYGYGWAAMVRVVQGGEVLFDGPVVLGQNTPKGGNPLVQPWVGVVKLSTLRPQVGIALTLFPDGEAYLRSIETGTPQPMIQNNAPFISYEEWTGKLLDNALTGLDTRFMHQTSSGLLGEGWTVDVDAGCAVSGPSGALPGSSSKLTCPHAADRGALIMSFPELRQYSTLQISRDATIPYVLAAAILIVLGLLPALYVSRRKVWVRARADGTGSILQVGGFALQRKDRFDEEFAGLVTAVTTAAGGRVDPAREEVPTP